MWAPIQSFVTLTDPSELRIPPAPTPLQFPQPLHVSPEHTEFCSLRDLERFFRVKQIKQLEPGYLHAVVASSDGEFIPLEDLIPDGYLPPKSWEESAYPSATERSSETVSSETLSNGAAVPGRETFHNRVRELSFDPDDVYRVLARKPGSPALRVIHYRKFWVQLKQVGNFWDTTKDNLDFNDSAVAEAYERQELERAKNKRRPSHNPQGEQINGTGNGSGHRINGTGGNTATATVIAASNRRTSQSKLANPWSEPERQSPPQRSWSGSSDYGFESPAPTPSARNSGAAPREFKYTGRRDSCGTDMPASMRGDMARALVEPVAHAFGCLVDPSKIQPRLRFGTTKLDVDHAARVYRGPRDRGRSRAGIREGPLMVIQCTHELDFAGRDELAKQLAAADAMDLAPDQPDVLADSAHVQAAQAAADAARACAGARHLFRELGALLDLALARDREGREERRFGAGAWWADKPRTGACSGETQGHPLVDDEGAPVTEEDVALASEAAAAAAAAEADPAARRGSTHEVPPKEPPATYSTAWNASAGATAPRSGLAAADEHLPAWARRGSGASERRGSGGGADKESAAQRKAEMQRDIRRTVRRKMIARSHTPPEPAWERLVDYARIGKAPEDEWDVVYMLSCLNHHAALVRMAVHPAFLAHLDRDRTRKLVPGAAADWYGVRLARSRWFDLFAERDRVELTRGIWGAVGWMMRRTAEPEGAEAGK